MATLAELDDLAPWLSLEIEDVDAARAGVALKAASARVRAEARYDFADEVPEDIAMVTAQVAARAYLNPNFLRQEATGPFSGTRDGAGIFLTEDDKKIIARFADSVNRGHRTWVLGIRRRDPIIMDFPYRRVPVAGGGEDFPFWPDSRDYEVHAELDRYSD